MEEKVKHLKEVFDNFLKKNNAYDAWYERYRLDNLMYEDEVPIENFIQGIIENNSIGSMMYFGIEGTCLCTKDGDKFIEENKKCDILSNGDFIDLDRKWINTWESLIKN